MPKRMLFAIALLAVGCQSTSQPLTSEEQAAVDEMRGEIEIGRGMAGRLLATFPPSSERRAAGYLNLVGTFVARQSPEPARQYMFQLTTDPNVAAFACPGGYVIVSTGTLKFAQNEAELAGVLAHEVAHVYKKHVLNAIRQKAEKKDGEAAEESARKRIEPGGDSKASSSMARYLSGGGNGLSIIMAAGGGLSTLLEEGLSPEQEFEADREGVQIMVKAGYDPQAYVDFLERLGREAKESSLKVMKKTHPSFADRLAALRPLVAELRELMPGGAIGSRRFAKMVGTKKAAQEPKAK